MISVKCDLKPMQLDIYIYIYIYEAMNMPTIHLAAYVCLYNNYHKVSPFSLGHMEKF